MKRRILSIFCVLALCLGLLPGTAWAAAGEMTQYTHYLALGDRTCAAHEAKGSIINYKYQPTPYPAWIAQAKGYILTTSAKDGETSASLLERLPEERAQIEKSAVISVTIGNTDLLYALRDYLTETYNKDHPDSTLTADQVLDKMGKVDEGFLEAMKDPPVGSGFVDSEIYKEAAAALEENLGKILETIQEYNPDAYLMVFNLYNPYRNMMEGGSNPDIHVEPYSAGVPTAYDKGAKAMNGIIAAVCGGSEIPVVDAYAAVMRYTSGSPYPDFNLRANLYDNGYQGIETFYPAQGTTKFIAEAVQQLNLPQGAGWPDNAASFANGYGIVVPSTSNNQWKVGNSNVSGDPYKNLWGLCLNMDNSLLSGKESYLNLLGALLAPENIRDGYDGPFLSQDCYWKTTGGLLDFDSGSETSFEGWNIRMDKDNATLFLRDVQLEAGTNCILINQNISNLFSGGTLNIALAGSNSFCSTAAEATITTNGHTGDLRFTGDGSLEITNNGSSNTNRAIVLEQGNLSIAEGAQVTVHTVPSSREATAIQAKTVTIEDGGALAVDLVAGSNAQPFKSESITVEEGGSLQVTVGSSLQAELPNLVKNSDLSNSTFTVDGLLVLSEWTEADLEASGVRFAGSGLVELSDGVYSISNGSLTPVDKTTIVSGNIAVTLGTAVTDQPGYTWEEDEETGAWVLTLKASTVVGNVTITQDTGEYDESLAPEEVKEPDKTYADEDTVIQLVTENPCTIYGQVEGVVTGRYISPRYRYFYQLGTLEISGAGLAADTVSYPFGTVQLSGALDATSISAWQLHLLKDADLTLSQGVSLTVNNSSYSAILFRMYNNQEELDKYTNETVKELVMARLKDTFTMEDGAFYSYTGAEGTSIQIKLSYSSLLGISLGDFTAPEYDCQQFRIELTQEDLASILQIPYDLKSAASPVFSQDTHDREDDENAYSAVFDGYITLQSEGALELPVVYGISASTTAEDFGTVTEGYDAPSEKTVTITNTGNQPVTLTQPAAANYTIGTPSKTTLNPEETATFTIRPSTGLAAGTYNETLTVSGQVHGHEVAADVELLFVVERKPSSGSPSSNTTTETTTNPDGSTTTIVTNKVTGTVTETTKFPDGSKEVIETKKDGTVTTTTTDTAGNKTQVVENTDGSSKTTVDNKDGSGSVTVVDENGQVVSEATLSQSAVAAAQEKGEAVTLPMPEVPVTTDRENAPTVTVDLPSGTSAKVEIPVADVTPGTVAVIVKADGTEEVIKTSLTTENGVAVTLSDGDTVKVVDNSKTFADVPGNYWGAEAVAFAVSRELFAGTSATTFAPDTAMTRAMIVTVLARFEGVDTTTGSTWYEASRQWAMENGVSDGSNMDQGLSREQLATMLWRYAGSPSVSNSLSGYTDAGTVSSYAQQAMAWCVEQGIIGGTTTTTLSPQGPATRAQVATILMRFIEGMA